METQNNKPTIIKVSEDMPEVEFESQSLDTMTGVILYHHKFRVKALSIRDCLNGVVALKEVFDHQVKGEDKPK